jgi:hypothetical protein
VAVISGWRLDGQATGGDALDRPRLRPAVLMSGLPALLRNSQ